MSEATTCTLSFPGSMVRRGFWLYVWRVVTPGGTEKLYVGRTGDNSTPNSTAPYTRMGQHLGFTKNSNALRRYLEEQNSIITEDCQRFDLISYGPIFPEVEGRGDLPDAARMEEHKKRRDVVGALEKKLADALRDSGHDVMNEISCKWPLDPHKWAQVKDAFGVHFPALKGVPDA